jgi:hypothetical protein
VPGQTDIRALQLAAEARQGLVDGTGGGVMSHGADTLILISV